MQTCWRQTPPPPPLDDMTSNVHKQQHKHSEGACYFPVLTLVLYCNHLLSQKCTRAYGWSAELPTAPSQSQLLTLFHHHFASLLFHRCYGADGARKGPVGPASTLQHKPFGLVSSPTNLEGEGPASRSSSLTQACATSSPWGDGRLYGLHDTRCIHKIRAT